MPPFYVWEVLFSFLGKSNTKRCISPRTEKAIDKDCRKGITWNKNASQIIRKWLKNRQSVAMALPHHQQPAKMIDKKNYIKKYSLTKK